MDQLHRNNRNIGTVIATIALLAALGVGLGAGQTASAAFVEVNWEVGSLPTDAGYDTDNPTIDTDAGTWTSTGGGWHANGGLPDLLTSDDDYVHGIAEIQAISFSTNPFDVTVTRFSRKPAGDPEFFFDINILEGEMVIRHGNAGNASSYGNIVPTGIAVANTDGEVHTYGWELDRTGDEPVVRLFFDNLGAPIGESAGYGVGFGNGDGSEHGFGDATGGEAHEEVWHSLIIAPGPIPEPASLLVVGLGGLVAMARRCRR